MTSSISFWAGKKAYSKIRSSGLSPNDVNVMAGAAGGPKWLVLNQLDRALFTSWLLPRKSPLFLVGSSIGAWRFATVSHEDPPDAIDRFQEAYLEQTYAANPTPEDVNAEVVKVLNRLMRPDSMSEILSHPFFRLNILSVRCRGLTGSSERRLLIPGLILSAMGNALFRKSLGLSFERVLFYDPRDLPPFFDMTGFPIHKVPLDAGNLKPALMASGSIPLIMPGVTEIPGAPAGVYRDGGVIDYHLNIPFMNPDDRIVLFPHYTERIVPGWLDKQIPWRKPEYSHMDNVLLIAPTRSFLDRLPNGKIPDRTDFREFFGRDKERVAYWRKVVDAGRELADGFIDAVETGSIRERVKPIAELTARR